MDMANLSSAEPWWKVHLARIGARAPAAGPPAGAHRPTGQISGRGRAVLSALVSPLPSLAAWRPSVTRSDLARGSRRVVDTAGVGAGLTFSALRYGGLPPLPSLPLIFFL